MNILASLRGLLPGLSLCAVIGLAALFLSREYGAPVILLSLLMGMPFYFLAGDLRCQPGLRFASRQLLRSAVALLGLQLSFSQVTALGWESAMFLTGAVASTMAFGIATARLLGIGGKLGLLTGSAVAICGASAALAVATTLPQTPQRERDTVFTVVAVTGISTVVMVFYPALCRMAGWSDGATGFFLGATIHDVAQVVGAGYSHSATAGDMATFTKMIRVALLIPVVMILGLLLRDPGRRDRKTPPLPGFLLVFATLFTINSIATLPGALTNLAGGLSRTLLVLAIAGLGVQTSLQQLARVGWTPLLLVIAETGFLALAAAAFISLSDLSQR